MAHIPLQRTRPLLVLAAESAFTGLAAEGGEQFGLCVGGVGHQLWWSDDASLAAEFGYPGEPASACLYELWLHRLVLTDGAGEIPAVYYKVRDELGDVFVARDVTEGQVDHLVHCAVAVNGCCGVGH
jgi:hypothetical protein